MLVRNGRELMGDYHNKLLVCELITVLTVGFILVIKIWVECSSAYHLHFFAIPFCIYMRPRWIVQVQAMLNGMHANGY